MILAAAVLVLVALGLFVGGIAIGATALYWACVAVSAVAAVLLFLARRQVARPAARVAAGGSPRAAAREPAPAVERAEGPATDPLGAAAVPRHARPEEPDGTASTADAPDGDVSARAVPARHTAETAAVRAAAAAPAAGEDEEPPIEEVEVTDLLLVVDLHEDVLVVDEHPRYHLADCPYLRDRTAIPLPMDEARTDGFTPCGICCPDRRMAEVERARRDARRSPS